MRSTLGACLLLLASPQAAPAEQAAPRTLAVPVDASWQHAATQLILPSRIAGLARGEIRDSGEAELDVSAPYQGPERGITATVYLYKTMTPDVALWFDRALTAIMARPEFGLAEAAVPAPTGFARPGGSTASGLRTALDLSAPNLRGTAVAIVPLGGWLVKVRLTAAELDRAALDELMTRFIQGLRWPAETRAERVAVPIQPCPSPLRFRRARVVRTEMSDTLMDALIGGIVLDEDTDTPPAIYCREPGATPERGVYRPGGSSDRYLIALGDSGIALAVGEASDLSALMGGGGGARRFSVTLLGRDSTTVYSSFNRLPAPEQAISVTTPSRASVTTTAPRNR